MSEITEKIKDRLTLSFSMQEEMNQLEQFLKVWEADEETIKTEYYDALEAELKALNRKAFDKNDSKKKLAGFREYCIDYVSRLPEKDYSKDKIGSKYPLFHSVYLEEDVDISELPTQVRTFIEKKIETPEGSEKYITRIGHYKDIFNAKGNDFQTQKDSGGVILAKNRDKLFYPGAPFCQSFGNEHFYYTSCVKNCCYDCSYCYLRGMYPCGYMTVFVNLEDYFRELEQLLSTGESVYLCVSYDTDLLALEPLLGYCERWIEFAAGHSNLKIEIRTKSGNAGLFKNVFRTSSENVIFAWTLSPEPVSNMAEKGMPSLAARLEAAKAAKDAGFPVRLCFDPMIFHNGWQKSYSDVISAAFSKLKPEEILDVSVGVFRISNNYLRRMRNVSSDRITSFPYVTESGACHYGSLSEKMQSFAVEEISKYYPKEKIYTWK